MVTEALTGRRVDETYKDLLQVGNANAGIDATLRPVADGEGTESALSISTTAALVTGNLEVTGALVARGDPATAQAVADTAGGKLFLVPASASVTVAVPSQYASVGAALAAIDQWQIPASATVTITVAAGTITSITPVLFDHPNGDRIRIVGAAALTRTISGQVSVSGSAGAWSVVLTIDSVTDVAVGNYLLTYNTTGTGDHYAHRGVWEITAVDSGASRVTVRNTHRGAAFPTNTITSGSSVVLRSVLAFTSCDGLVVPSATLGELNDVMIAGNSDSYWSSSDVSGTELGTHGIYVGGPTVAVNGKADNVNSLGVSGGHVSCGQFVGVSGFDQQGIVTEMGGTVWGDYLASCNNKRRGFYASTASGIRAKHTSACGNYMDGAIVDLGGSIYSTSVSCAAGNGGAGFSCTQSGFLAADTGITSGNRGDGFKATSGAMLQATSALAMNNGLSGFSAEYGSTLYCNGSTSTGNAEHGLHLAFNSTARADGMTCSGNALYGMRATEYSYATITSVTSAGNGSGDRFLRNGAMLLNGSTAYAADQTIAALTVSSIDSGAGNVVTTGELRGSSWRLTDGSNTVIADATGVGDLALSFTGTSRYVMKANGVFHPSATGTQDLGRTSERWNNVHATKYAFGASTQHISSGSGTPEGAVAASVGSLFLRTDGGASTTLYIKESGTGSAGWRAV